MSASHQPHSLKIEDLASSGWADYELLDSGNQQKLERFGSYRLARFEPEAVWKPALNAGEWASAQARFTLERGENQGNWARSGHMPDEWTIQVDPLTVNLYLKQSRHIGIFPEQLPNWRWIKQSIRHVKRGIRVLNLFAYTGISTVFAALADAEVTHVESAKSSLMIARKNLEYSGLSDRHVRWMADDVFKFVQRELRRGSRYDAIIMDPPKFGRGPGGEVWKFESGMEGLLESCTDLLSEDPLFFLITAYNINIRPVDLGRMLQKKLSSLSGEIRCGNLIQQERSAGRKISQSIYARWENKPS
jgi:23S rRNA (cytosine1962-C5)-methyltransferase